MKKLKRLFFTVSDYTLASIALVVFVLWLFFTFVIEQVREAGE